jgi:hypothetical protein
MKEYPIPDSTSRDDRLDRQDEARDEEADMDAEEYDSTHKLPFYSPYGKDK